MIISNVWQISRWRNQPDGSCSLIECLIVSAGRVSLYVFRCGCSNLKDHQMRLFSEISVCVSCRSYILKFLVGFCFFLRLLHFEKDYIAIFILACFIKFFPLELAYFRVIFPLFAFMHRVLNCSLSLKCSRNSIAFDCIQEAQIVFTALKINYSYIHVERIATVFSVVYWLWRKLYVL